MAHHRLVEGLAQRFFPYSLRLAECMKSDMLAEDRQTGLQSLSARHFAHSMYLGEFACWRSLNGREVLMMVWGRYYRLLGTFGQRLSASHHFYHRQRKSWIPSRDASRHLYQQHYGSI